MPKRFELTARDKRTLKIGAVIVVLYLALFFGLRAGKRIEAARREYDLLARNAQTLALRVRRYETRILLLEKLRAASRVDVKALNRVSLVADASAAIQDAAKSGGIQLGPIREAPGRASAFELASMQIEGTGQVPAMLELLHRLEALGFPLIIESIQITPETSRPGNVKLNLQLVLIDYAAWKAKREDADA